MGSSDAAAAAAEDLSHPPPTSADAPLWVDFRVGASRLNQVNTAQETAYIKSFVALYWTDPRMIGYSKPTLPDDLWGPYCNCRNGMRADMDCDDHEFVLVDPDTGRLKRFLIFEGVISNNLDLSEFPFDMNTIDIEFGFVSHWRTHDGSRGGTSAKRPVYLVRSVTDPSEGDPIGIFWNKKIPEWELHGASWSLKKHEDKSGYVQQQLKLSFFVGRHVSFYMLKVLLPLYLLLINFASDFFLPPSDLSSRSSNTMTGFLAAFAFLYVIAEMLPKVEFLTRIDQIVLVTLIGMTLCGIEAWTVFLIDDQYSTRLARKVNWIFGLSLAGVYIFFNLIILLPGIRLKQRALEKWKSKAASTTVHIQRSSKNSISPKSSVNGPYSLAEQGLTEWHVDLTSPT
eukprot:m.133888 g.133888  ORF g.133888 m.133888 type:complete len:398 (-) comp22504_c0_seq2:213-1406(-)